MRYFIFILIFFTNLVLVLASFMLPERKIVVMILLFIFLILLILYSYFVFYKVIKDYLLGISKHRIKKIIKLLIYVLVFVFSLFILKNIQIFKISTLNTMEYSKIKNYSNLDNIKGDFNFYYIGDEKSDLIKNYLDEFKFLVNNVDIYFIDPIFDGEKFNELSSRLGKTIKKGTLIINKNDSYVSIKNINITNIMLSLITLSNGKKRVCVYSNENKSIYDFNETGLAVFASIIEEGGFELVEKNHTNCDVNILFEVGINFNYNEFIRTNENVIIISNTFQTNEVSVGTSIIKSQNNMANYSYLSKNLISKFNPNTIFSNIIEEVIAGQSSELIANSSNLIAFVKDNMTKDVGIILEKNGVIYISAPNILSNLFMQNIGNQDFARYLIYSSFEIYKNVLELENTQSENFISSQRYFKYIKILLFFILPVFVCLLGIIVFLKQTRSSKND